MKDLPTKETLHAKASEERSLTRVDPLRQYMAEVQKYPLLTDEEERNLAELFRETGDVEAARKLVQSHLRLVVKIAMDYRSAYYNMLDLIQEGNVGLMVAVKKFDPDKGARLGHYATWWIKSFVLKYLLDNFRLIKIGTTKNQRKLFYNLVQEKQKIEAMGFKPNAEMLAGRLGVSVDEINSMSQRLTQPERSLEAPINNESSSSLSDFIADDDIPFDEKLAQAELKNIFSNKLKEFSSQLNKRDKVVFQERLMSEVPRTLQDIADEFKISKERARQIESRIMEKLRDHISEAGLGIEVNSEVHSPQGWQHGMSKSQSKKKD